MRIISLFAAYVVGLSYVGLATAPVEQMYYYIHTVQPVYKKDS